MDQVIFLFQPESSDLRVLDVLPIQPQPASLLLAVRQSHPQERKFGGIAHNSLEKILYFRQKVDFLNFFSQTKKKVSIFDINVQSLRGVYREKHRENCPQR